MGQMSLTSSGTVGNRPPLTRWGSISPILPIILCFESAIFALLWFTRISGWYLLISGVETLLIGVGFLLVGPWFYVPRVLRFAGESATFQIGHKSVVVAWQDVIPPVYRSDPSAV
jgi:hypothetical protein